MRPILLNHVGRQRIALLSPLSGFAISTQSVSPQDSHLTGPQGHDIYARRFKGAVLSKTPREWGTRRSGAEEALHGALPRKTASRGRSRRQGEGCIHTPSRVCWGPAPE